MIVNTVSQSHDLLDCEAKLCSLSFTNQSTFLVDSPSVCDGPESFTNQRLLHVCPFLWIFLKKD